MTDEQSLVWNCQIRCGRGKTLKFVETAQIREFWEACDAHEKLTTLVMPPDMTKILYFP